MLCAVVLNVIILIVVALVRAVGEREIYRGRDEGELKRKRLSIHVKEKRIMRTQREKENK